MQFIRILCKQQKNQQIHQQKQYRYEQRLESNLSRCDSLRRTKIEYRCRLLYLNNQGLRKTTVCRNSDSIRLEQQSLDLIRQRGGGLQFIVKRMSTNQIIGCISIPIKQIVSCGTTCFDQWFTLFDDIFDDEFDGDIGENDGEETPKVYFNLQIENTSWDSEIFTESVIQSQKKDCKSDAAYSAHSHNTQQCENLKNQQINDKNLQEYIQLNQSLREKAFSLQRQNEGYQEYIQRLDLSQYQEHGFTPQQIFPSPSALDISSLSLLSRTDSKEKQIQEITYKYDSEIQILNHLLKQIQNECVKYQMEKVDRENHANQLTQVGIAKDQKIEKLKALIEENQNNSLSQIDQQKTKELIKNFNKDMTQFQEQIYILNNILEERDTGIYELIHQNNGQKMQALALQTYQTYGDFQTLENDYNQLQIENQANQNQVKKLQVLLDQSLKTPRNYYICKKRDKIDECLDEYLKQKPVPVKFVRLEEGVYQFGSRRVIITLQKKKLMVRVGVGFQIISDFLKSFTQVELIKMKQTGDFTQLAFPLQFEYADQNQELEIDQRLSKKKDCLQEISPNKCYFTHNQKKVVDKSYLA